MGIHRGPNTVKDGLVFGYDSGYGVADNNTATRFYPGESTVNYTTDTPSQGGWTGTYSVLDSSLKKFRFNVSSFSANPGSGWRSFTWDLRAYTGQSVTISATVEAPSTSPGTFAWVMMGQGNTHTNSSGAGGYMGYSAASERVYKSTTTKERITWSGTLGNSGTASSPSGHVGFTVWYNNGVPGVNSFIEVSDVQIELKSHETPFINGTRSDTASLIDLKRTTDIDVSNISFDSTGQPEFDGTNDVISIDVDDIVRQSTNITIEGIVELASISSAGPWSIMTDHATTADRDGFWWHMNIGGSVYFRVEDNVNGEQGTTFSGGVPFIANTTQHIVTIVGASGVSIYVNGELSKTYTPSFKWSQIDSSKTAYLTIGRTYPNYFLNSKNRVVKMYNRALTAEEIKKNFNAYKNRFNI